MIWIRIKRALGIRLTDEEDNALFYYFMKKQQEKEAKDSNKRIDDFLNSTDDD